MEEIDRRALDVMESVRPVWNGITRADLAIAISERMLLHAGPPVHPKKMAKAVINSAVMAILYEGWTDDMEQARGMLLSGEVMLKPAQDLGAVVPLASVLSPSMSAVVVTDENNRQLKAVSTLNGGMQYALRLGLCNPGVLAHLRWLNGVFSEILREAIPEDGIHLIPIADFGLCKGDDCHGRTMASSARLLEQLKSRLAANKHGNQAVEYITSSPPFFLNLWMAATKSIMEAAKGMVGSSVITAIGGNGIEFGLQLAGLPGRWFTVLALPPDAVYNPGLSSDNALGAIGDSAVVDALGLGAMALRLAPAQQNLFGPVLPHDTLTLPNQLLARTHGGFVRNEVLFGLTARRVLEANNSLVISLGVIDIEGKQGRIGGGIYRPPLQLFSAACQGAGLHP